MADDQSVRTATARVHHWKRASYLVLLGLLALTLLWAGSFAPVKLAELDGPAVTSLIGSLLVATVLLERALEVFLNVTRQPGRKSLDRAVKAAKTRLETASGDDSKAEQEALETARAKLTTYRADTARIASLWGVVGGVIISLSGIRALHSLLAPGMVIESSTQYMLFSTVDVFVTGLLFAGGSDGVHQVAALLTGYFEKKKDEVEESKP